MSRITKEQKAGIDFLDQICFNELVVHLGLDSSERDQLKTLTSCVTEMTKSKYSGQESQVVKHFAYCFLEGMLINNLDEWQKALHKETSLGGGGEKTRKYVDEEAISFQQTLILASTRASLKSEVEIALEIAEKIKEQFVNYSPLIRRDLVKRCFAFEFKEASLGCYCWLITSGVLQVTKHHPERIRPQFNNDFLKRLALIAEYETITHSLSILLKQKDMVSEFLNISNLNLTYNTTKQMRAINDLFYDVTNSPKSDRLIILPISNFQDKVKIKEFFQTWGAHKGKLRMHNGTLASWLSFIGSMMVEIEYKFSKKLSIFSSLRNQGSITDIVKTRLSEYGLHIDADTLYRSHSKLKQTKVPLLSAYCTETRKYGVVMPTSYEDIFYIMFLIHADK